MVEEKISLAACNGMSATGLISRVAVADLIDEDEKLISICITATSTDKPAFVKLIKKYPILGVNGCNNNCVGHILKTKGVDIVGDVDVLSELNDAQCHLKNVARLDEVGEEAVDIIKSKIYEKIRNLD